MSIASIKARLEACPWPGELAIFHDNYDRSTWCVFPVEHGEPSEQVPSGVYLASEMPVASDMEREWAEWFVSAPTDLRALLRVAEAAANLKSSCSSCVCADPRGPMCDPSCEWKVLRKALAEVEGAA